MSDLVYPVFPGFTFTATKSPTWHTRRQVAISGRDMAIPDFAMPVWEFTLTYSVLHDISFGSYTAPNTALRTFMDFFNQINGGYDTFLFDDETDDAVSEQEFGIGDGATLSFQLVRQLVSGGFVETLQAINTVTTVFDNGTPVSGSDYSVNHSTGLLTFVVAPITGHILTWTGTFYFRVRFAEDMLNFDRFMYFLWEMKTVKLRSVVT